jgi:hypothetical protein
MNDETKAPVQDDADEKDFDVFCGEDNKLSSQDKRRHHRRFAVTHFFMYGLREFLENKTDYSDLGSS